MNDGSYIFYINKQENICEGLKIVLINVQSRHSNATKFRSYVKYKPNLDSHQSIEGWYCTCKNGSRTVGCCSHISSVIFFFSCGRYNENLRIPNSNLLSIFPFHLPPESDEENNESYYEKDDEQDNEQDDEPNNDPIDVSNESASNERAEEDLN